MSEEFRTLTPEQVKHLEMLVGADGHPEEISEKIKRLICKNDRLSEERGRFHRATQECLAWIEKFTNGKGNSFAEKVRKDFGI